MSPDKRGGGAYFVKKNPNLIDRIAVKYFRSINNQTVRECLPLNIITGPNDVGKSNLLRALNLFFNGGTSDGRNLVFSDEFSHSRLESVRKESVKGKQFIQIEITFNCRGSFSKTLPPKFTVKKTWFRDSSAPKLAHNLEAYIKGGKLNTTLAKAEGSLQRFLNSIVFTYIPAIKDKQTFRSVLSELQSVLFNQRETVGSTFNTDIERFTTDLEKQAQELREEFKNKTGVEASISLPTTYAELFRAFDVRTKGAYDEAVALDHRGDGVRVRFLPAIMNYIAERSPKLHVWGFEEPENSMEYRRAFELSKTMATEYSRNAQIFLTTHSPAFIDIKQERQSIYMASATSSCDTVFTLLNAKQRSEAEQSDPTLLIANELGHIQLMNELHGKLEARIQEVAEAQEQHNATANALATLQQPVLLTEGKTDAMILRVAWDKLRNTVRPFDIRSCDVLLPDDPNEAAGAGQLALCLRTVMASQANIVMGLFDRDSEGEKGWSLDANFAQDKTLTEVRSAKNGKAHGILMPVPDGGEPLAAASNLPIEFLFARGVLDTRVNGRGLILEPLPVIVQCGGKVIEKSPGTELWQMKIKDGKKPFAEDVVPSLHADAFSQFEKIFGLVEALIAKAAG